MKRLILLHALILNLSLVFAATNLNHWQCQNQWLADIGEQKSGKELWSKNVWSTIDTDQLINSPVFQPLNEFISGYNNIEDKMELSLFETEKSKIKCSIGNF